MEEDMATEDFKVETEEVDADESAEMQGDDDAGAAEGDEAGKNDEEGETKEPRVRVVRYAPHTIPDWQIEHMRERWMWHVRIYPIDQEDCRNCILDAATKISQEAWYYVPKRRNGQGHAELCMVSKNEASAVMSRILRMPFYHRFVTIEINKRLKAEGEGSTDGEAVYKQVEETATFVIDSTKAEKIKSTATSKGSLKRRKLWIRYLSENTSSEILRVIFPQSVSSEVQTHENLRIGMVEAHSRTDVLFFMRAFLTVVINGIHVQALQNKEPNDKELESKTNLDALITPVQNLEVAPIEVADRTEKPKEDRGGKSRKLKRSHFQQREPETRRTPQQSGNKRGWGEPPAKRGSGGNWGDNRRSGGGGARYGGGGAYDYGYSGSYGGGHMSAQDVAAEMMMMQAQLNRSIQSQLMMFSPATGSRRYGGGGGGGGGMGGGGGRGGRRKVFGGGGW